jgi:hypothetical protein
MLPLAQYQLSILYQHVTTVRHASRLFSISRVIRDYTMTLPLQPAETWHGHYDDPNGDLVLVSSERVKLRISARLLAKHG